MAARVADPRLVDQSIHVTVARAGATVFEFGERGFDSCGKFPAPVCLEIGRLEILKQEFRIDMAPAANHAVFFQRYRHIAVQDCRVEAIDYKTIARCNSFPRARVSLVGSVDQVAEVLRHERFASATDQGFQVGGTRAIPFREHRQLIARHREYRYPVQ